ncbi:MAG: FAD-binding protein [Solirubrobacteraceae bacterium]
MVRPRTPEELAELLLGTPPGRGLIARGAGRSYGDPAQNAGGTVIEMQGLAGVRAIDTEKAEVRSGAGTSFERLLVALAAHGQTLPVVPGTRHLTVGGAIASDIHGKNHPHAGSIAAQLTSFMLCTPTGRLVEVARRSEPELFRATLGGMGLTGVVVDATLRTIPLRRPYALGDIDRVASLEDAIALMRSMEHSHAIAWLDLLAEGSLFGRAVVTRSREGPELAGAEQLRLVPRPRLGVPAGLSGGFLRPAAVRAFNAALWHRAPRSVRGRSFDICAQLFPLDRVDGWNRLYGRAGLTQYQFAVPSGAEPTLRAVIELLRAERLPAYLAALKRFGPGSGGMLSFPIEGWTLAVDLPAGAPGLRSALDRADELVASVAGRVYLAKDARMRPAAFEAMYPEASGFRELRARIDPHGTLCSDMARRLGLSE